MLATVRWGAVMVGMGAGLLSLAAVSVLAWLVLSASGADADAATGGAITVGTVAGFGVAGAVAGRRTRTRMTFHGALAAMLVAVVVTVVSVRGGSPAPTVAVLLLAGFAIGIGGSAAALLGRRARRPARESRRGGSRG